MPRTGLEPARLSTLAPETSASTIPPPGQYTDSSVVDTNSNLWAENETRTRDPNLGKVVLYQLSYFRICFAIFQRTNGIVPFCECKGTAFFWTAKQIREKNAFFFDFLFLYPWIPYLWHIENLYSDLPCYGVHCLLYFAKLEVWLYFKCVKYNNNAEKA